MDIIFAGHNHYYARAAVDGIQHITTGGGGAPLYSPNPNAEYIVESAAAYHFCEVDIQGDDLYFTARDNSGLELDSFHLGPPVDTDNDGVTDDQDNCILIPNGTLIPDAGGNSQLDTDGDGYGNLCDADCFPLPQGDGFVDFADLTRFSEVFFTADPDADHSGDGFVDFLDLTIFAGLFFQPPGPSCCGTP